MFAQHLPNTNRSILKVALLAAIALIAALGVFAQPASSSGPAAPFILEPGVTQSSPNGTGVFTAKVHCGNWYGVARFTAGINGQRYVTRTVYICQTTKSANLRFVVRPSQLGPEGNYQYRIQVGRHSDDGTVTRWTHALTGSFRYE
jgi:hypothetical protein